MKISTVITLYNLEKYIDDAIQSVLGQTRQSEEISLVICGAAYEVFAAGYGEIAAAA